MPLNPQPAVSPRTAVAGALVVGAVAGLVAALFLTISAEPSIEEAIRIEQAADHGDEHADEVVSRDVQRGVGLFGAYAVSGAGFGLLFGFAFVAARRSQPDPFRRALVCGAALAGAMTASPWLKYPPNPPAVGDPDTLGRRQLLYVLLIVLTAAVVLGVAWLSRRLQAWPEPRRVAAVVAALAVALLAVYAVLPPAPDAVTVPATLVWRFRLASLGGNLVLWTVLTLGFGLWVSERKRVAEAVAA
ncbi:MAG: CbtA family protein [Acidimicrobiales bacterium]